MEEVSEDIDKNRHVPDLLRDGGAKISNTQLSIDLKNTPDDYQFTARELPPEPRSAGNCCLMFVQPVICT